MVEEIRKTLRELFPSAELEVRQEGDDQVRVSWWKGALDEKEVSACIAKVSGYKLKTTTEVPFGEYGIHRIHVINTYHGE